MMTHEIMSWPVAYSIFCIGMLLVAWITYHVLHFFERRKLRNSLAANRMAM